MPSLIQGYEYDIFISYRHNDNLDGWVTAFVESLEKELKGTLKDSLTIYFDRNPHDGLLETHNVDKSLEGKLKCLIFIPILSQTYCDPKSFAWQQEFCAFIKSTRVSAGGSSPFGLAKPKAWGQGVERGLDIKLSNGNVTSRILPIKIHDLDANDKATIEVEIGGVLRAIEFVFKSQGVNRPLRATEDHPQDNQNKTFYRDQINKVANAIKEIINAIKSPVPNTSVATSNTLHATGNNQIPTRKKTIFISIALLLIFAVGYLFYKYQTRTAKQGTQLDKSIAVLSFEDMSPNHDQQYFGDGMAEEIINVLAQSGEIKVIARSSSFQFKGKNEDLRTIGKMLDVATILEGSVRKSDNLIRVTAQLISTEDGAHLWSKTFDRKPADIFSIQDEIASAIATALKATLTPNLTSEKKEVWNDEAMKLYQSGRFYFDRKSEGDGSRARDFFKQSLKSDSTHAVVWAYYAVNFLNTDGDYASFERFNRKALQLDSLNSDALVNQAVRSLSGFDHKTAKRIIDKAYFLYPKDARVLRNLCNIYNSLGLLDQALVFGKIAITADPLQARAYDNLNGTYYYMKQYDSSNRVGKKLREVNPNYIGLRSYFATNYIMMGQYDSVLLEIMNSSVSDKAFYECAVSFAKGDKKTSDEKLALFKLNTNNNYGLALIHCFRKEFDLALDYIEKSYMAREGALSSFIKVEPGLDPLRNHPRFIAILKKCD